MSIFAEPPLSRGADLDWEVVHLSATPLVGAPGKIAAVCNRIGLRSTTVVYSDYPGALKGLFTRSSLIWNDAPRAFRCAAEERLESAALVHIHNDLPSDMLEWIIRYAVHAVFIYQVHSPMREGPLYLDRAGPMGLTFAKRLTVGQYHPRHWQDHRPVPNIIDAQPSIRPYRQGEKLRVLFTPSHGRDGRWNAKTSEEVTTALDGLAKTKLIEVIWLEKPIAPEQLLELRRSCHVTIDEVVTGSHHQISLEGLCCGNVVINGADFFSQAMACAAAQATEPPPFLRAHPNNLAETLLQLAFNPERTASLQRASLRYFQSWLLPERLANIYIGIYREALNAQGC